MRKQNEFIGTTRDLAGMYNRAKANYYETRIKSGNGTTIDFYRLVSHKTNDRQWLPLSMTRNNLIFTGESRIAELAKCLGENFNSPPFHNFTFRSLHQRHYSDRWAKIWQKYINVVTVNEIKTMIGKLKERKDIGPMKISVQLLKYHKDHRAPIIANVLTTILASGVIPSN